MTHLTPTPSLLLVGTDTGVGKTTVGRGLLCLAHLRGLRILPYKPVETGCGTHGPSDAIELLQAAEIPGLELRDVCPYAFAAPVAPSVAAHLESRPINVAQLLQRARDLAGRGDALLVEGAGGLLTPYAPNFTAVTLATRLDLDILIVAANRLGAINHTALAVAECRRQALKCRGIVLVDVAPTRTPDQDYNAREIAAACNLEPLGVLPHLDVSDTASIARALTTEIDLRGIFGGRLA